MHIIPDYKKVDVNIEDKLGGMNHCAASNSYMEAVADIVFYHKPRKVHNVTCGGTNIYYVNPSGI